MRCLFPVLLFILSPICIFSQDYNYSHYDSRDGLGSATVYCITQDKFGFLWFGTETGVTRFDGTHFRTFTKEDGLPDNDITQLFADSKGRVWMSPFKKSVCYAYKGTIRNTDNDSLLKKLRIHDNVIRFAEDNAGNILLQEVTRVHLIQPDGRVFTYLTNGTKPWDYITTIGARREGGFYIMQNGEVYSLRNNRFLLWEKVKQPYNHLHFNYGCVKDETLMWRRDTNTVQVWSFDRNKSWQFFSPNPGYVNTIILDQRYAAYSTLSGAYVLDLNTGNTQRHLAGVAISNMFKDSEGNFWFSTLGKGIYRLNSSVVLNVDLAKRTRDYYWEQSGKRSREYMMAANVYDLVKEYSQEDGKRLGQFSWNNNFPVYNILSLPDGNIALGAAFYLNKLSPELNRILGQLKPVAVKSMCMSGNNLLLATDKEAVRIDPRTFKVIDTIWRERPACIFSNKDTIYIGTLNGLYQLLPKQKPNYLGEKINALRNRITAVREDDNHVIWATTAGDGLIGWRNGEVVATLTRHNGLASNNCRTLYYENGHLWVGTDKGLCKVHVLQPGAYHVDKYTTSDGLSSDIINTIYVNNKKVFVGTPEGITFFEEDKIASQSQCLLRFLDIAIAGKTYYPADAPAIISHKKNSIEFNYVGISYKSNGDIRYRYQLKGLDSTWRETRETFLSYPTLPSGEYELKLQAINKFDVKSELLTIGFTIDKLLYERVWFQLLIGLLFLGVVGFTVWLIIRRIRKREQEKTAMVKRINDLEQLSRKAQMNPHFIFNSLNSIQQYVMDADVAGANKFISGFSRLIRQTLDFSSRPEISLEEELDYLTNYLDIERTRLENAFAWEVEIDTTVNPADYYIPPMILQPFVENSVRHGLRFRKDKEGKVIIAVNRQGDHLVCILEDNGVGRKAALHYKSISPINYQSKGLSLTADRIEMFNKEHEQKISMHIDDLEDEAQNALGTRVTIHFPVL